MEYLGNNVLLKHNELPFFQEPPLLMTTNNKAVYQRHPKSYIYIPSESNKNNDGPGSSNILKILNIIAWIGLLTSLSKVIVTKYWNTSALRFARQWFHLLKHKLYQFVHHNVWKIEGYQQSSIEEILEPISTTTTATVDSQQNYETQSQSEASNNYNINDNSAFTKTYVPTTDQIKITEQQEQQQEANLVVSNNTAISDNGSSLTDRSNARQQRRMQYKSNQFLDIASPVTNTDTTVTTDGVTVTDKQPQQQHELRTTQLTSRKTAGKQKLKPWERKKQQK